MADFGTWLLTEMMGGDAVHTISIHREPIDLFDARFNCVRKWNGVTTVTHFDTFDQAMGFLDWNHRLEESARRVGKRAG